MRQHRTPLSIAIAIGIPWILLMIQEIGGTTSIPVGLIAGLTFLAFLAWATAQLVAISAAARAREAEVVASVRHRRFPVR